jgi:hypothetical protein
MEQFKTWEQMSELEQLEYIYCDMHKDVYGVKARWYRATSLEQARADIDALQLELTAQMEADARFQQQAIEAFEQLVDSFGGVWETAKRWQHDAYDTAGDDEYLEYRMGLPYGYFKRNTL